MRNKIVLILPRTGPAVLEPPFGYMCLAASLKKCGYEPLIIDSRIESYKSRLSEIDRNSILAVGLTSMTGPQIWHAIKISRYIKRFYDLPVIWGGIHPTLLPEQTMEEASIDYIVMGYGELILPKLLDSISSGSSPEDIANIVYRDPARRSVIRNKRVYDVEDYPMEYDWDSVDMSKYIHSGYMIGKYVLSLFTSSGCTHSCSFCYGNQFHLNKMRYQTLESVSEDIDKLAEKYNFDSIYFRDDNFFINRTRALSITKLLKKRRIPFACSIRADYSDEELISTLKADGCVQVDWGSESGSQKVLDLYNKGITVEDIERTARLTAKYDLMAFNGFLMGHPEETIEDIKETMDFIDRIRKINRKLVVSDIKILTPYPGTEIYEYALSRGFKAPSSLKEWSRYYWNSGHLISKEKEKFLNRITIVSIFAFISWRFNNWNIFYRFTAEILRRISSFRWKNRFFAVPVDIYILRFIINMINRFIYR